MPIAKPIRFNDLYPPAPAGKRNVNWQGDDADPANVSAYSDPVGGVNAQTGTMYEVVAGDSGKLLTLDNADPIAVTLPEPDAVPDNFWFLVKNLGAGLATLVPIDYYEIDGEASLDLAQGAWAAIFRQTAGYISLPSGAEDQFIVVED